MYRSTFTPSSDGTCRDIYDGCVYQQLEEEGLFSNDLDIALLLFNVGFSAKKRQLTILNMVILNFSPLIHYENKRQIQLAIIPGPSEPKNLISFLEPMLKELEMLQETGMNIEGDDGNNYHAKVHLLIGNV